MDEFSLDEIKALGNILRLNVGELVRMCNMWGRSAQNCVWFSRGWGRSLEDAHKSRVDAAVLGFVKDFHVIRSELDALNFSNVLFSIQPKNKSGAGRAVPVAHVATKHINNLILKATTEFRSTASYILKAYVLAWLSAYPASTPIPCTAAAGMMADMSRPALVIPVCSKDQSIPLTDLNIIRNVPPPFCLLTVPQNCAPLDAIVGIDEVIITVQAVSSRYRTERCDFEQIHAQLSLLFGESRQWCHVYVTGDEENAVALRYEPRDIPADLNVMIFTAVFNLGHLDPIRERLDELIEERVSRRYFDL
ncbi:hypothetical protein V8E53_014078 [Lactarius tabidus]